MSRQEPWKTLLEPWATRHTEFRADLDSYLRECDDDELTTIADACQQPTQTNCWWATFEVAKVIAEAIKSETYRRTRANEATS